MIILKRATKEDRWDPEPLTWWPAISDGKRTAFVVCAKGHGASVVNHSIAPNGEVRPSVVCGHSDCDWHVHLKLEGWVP